MAKRLVEIERWRDLFWNELHPYPKILLCYMYDNADQAGFIDYSAALWLTQLKGKSDNRYSEFTKKDLINSLADLKDKLVSNGKRKLFIKDFLIHQKKLPLTKGNEEDEWIITKLKSNLEKFNNAPEILNIINNHIVDPSEVKIVANKQPAPSRKKVFVEPTFEELKAYYLSQKPDAELSAIQGFYDYYVGCGWVMGKSRKPVVDWQACVRTWIKKDEGFVNDNRGGRNNYGSGENKKSRTEVILSVADRLKKNE